MGKVQLGANFKLYIDGSVAAYCESFSKKNSKGKVEITSRSSVGEWREYQSTGVKGGSLDLSGVVVRPGYAPSSEKSFDELINKFYSSNDDVSAMIEPVDVSGYKEEFNIIMDDLTQNFGSIEDKVAYDIAATINGPVTRTLV